MESQDVDTSGSLRGESNGRIREGTIPRESTDALRHSLRCVVSVGSITPLTGDANLFGYTKINHNTHNSPVKTSCEQRSSETSKATCRGRRCILPGKPHLEAKLSNL